MTQTQSIPAKSEKYRYHRECETTLIETIPTATDVEKFFLERIKGGGRGVPFHRD